MKKVLCVLSINVGFSAAVWFGFIEDVEGAQYLAKFWVWAVTLPMAFMVLTDAVQEKLAAEPRTPALAMVQQLIAWFALGVFIWHGHMATAAAWGFWMLAATLCRGGVKKRRAGLSAAPTA